MQRIKRPYMDLKSVYYKGSGFSKGTCPLFSQFSTFSLLCNTISALMDCTASRRPCFVEENGGFASLPDLEAEFSGGHGRNHNGFFSRSSFRNFLVSSPRSVRFYDARFEERRPYFLEACFLCKRTLGGNRDIFMYRGDTPFCSEECRQEQIEIDEAKEKKLSSSSMEAMRKNDQRQSPSASKASARGYNFISSTLAAA